MLSIVSPRLIGLGVCKCCRVHGRHPYPRLVNFEQIGDEGVEIDIRIGKIVESELLPVPTVQLVTEYPDLHIHQCLHLELCIQDFHR